MAASFRAENAEGEIGFVHTINGEQRFIADDPANAPGAEVAFGLDLPGEALDVSTDVPLFRGALGANVIDQLCVLFVVRQWTRGTSTMLCLLRTVNRPKKSSIYAMSGTSGVGDTSYLLSTMGSGEANQMTSQVRATTAANIARCIVRVCFQTAPNLLLRAT